MRLFTMRDNRKKRRRTRRLGFTLIEILIVVVILGILAAVTVPKFASASDDAARTTFINNLRAFVDAAYYFELDTGTILEDSSSGVIPTGFDDFVLPEQWEAGTPIGGVWDVEQLTIGPDTFAAVGVHFDGTGTTRDDAYMAEIDLMVDDGDVTTGVFQRIAANRYYVIID